MPLSHAYAHEQRSRWLKQFPQEHEMTLGLVESCPPEKLAWAPHELSMPFNELVLHIYSAGPWFLKFFSDTQSGFSNSSPSIPTTHSEIIEACNELFGEFYRGLSQISGSQLAEDRPFLTFGDFPGVQIIEWHLSHWIHHRGQLQLYLRLMGAVCPPIYGPTADIRMEQLSQPTPIPKLDMENQL